MTSGPTGLRRRREGGILSRVMRILVTGSSGHLGEALVRTLRQAGHDVVSLDIRPSPFTTCVGSITDRGCVSRCMAWVQVVFHAATLHRPHVDTHRRQAFIDTNISGTLNLLEEAAAADVGSFVFTSTTSVFGDALVPPAGAPAAWITEEVTPIPRNIYGVTKAAAENLCQIFNRNNGLACIVLRTSRFFPEEDDDSAVREAYADANIKVNEYLYRRVDLEDVVSAHLLAAERAPALGFRRSVRLRPLRPATSRTCGPPPRAPRAVAFLFMRQNTRAGAGGWSRASIASMSTNGPAMSSAGSRAAISSASSPA